MTYRGKLIVEFRQHGIVGKVGGVSLQNLKLLMEAVLIIVTPVPSTRHCPIQHPSCSAASLQENHLKSYAQNLEIHTTSNKVTKRRVRFSL